MSAALYFHTVRHLKPPQVLARIPRLRDGSVAPDEAVVLRQRATDSWRPHILREPAHTLSAPNRFRFLNQEREITGWNDPGIPKLWLYNLHYSECPEEALINRWIDENPIGTGNGWEPYPLSLRIVSWIKWALVTRQHLPPKVLRSLYQQAAWLASRVEHQLLANHIFANAKALVFAGTFFTGQRAEAWLREGLRLLTREVPEQILADGGHFERSPMYHSLILEDLLDLLNLHPPGAPTAEWRSNAARMLGWLDQMCHPDGRISFFNDAAFSIAPEPHQLHHYAERDLGIRPAANTLSESGYIRLQNAETVVLFDAAPVGPDYQPGHAHADTLSFELSHRGRRALVNSGTSTYERSPERHRQRSTPAHNTIDIDDQDQSEVWAAFRVARRAKPFDIATDHRTFAEAAHDGYKRLPHPVVHRRRLELTSEGLIIQDSLEGRGTHTSQLHFHFHPDDRTTSIQLDPKLNARVEPATWHPEFNQSIPTRKLTGVWRGPLPVVFRSFVPLP